MKHKTVTRKIIDKLYWVADGCIITISRVLGTLFILFWYGLFLYLLFTGQWPN